MAQPALSIFLFGPFRVLVGGEPMPRVRTRSVEWLLALLVLRHGREVERSWLAGTLWPDSEEGQGLQNLRHALVSLRKALGPESGRIQSPTRDLLTFDLEGAEVDVVRFDSASKAPDEEALLAAVEVYTGPLLEGCPAEWALVERGRRAQQCLQALETLAERAQSRDHGSAIRFLQRAEALDPLKDSIARSLMTSLEATGDPAAAVDVYRRLLHRLHNELSTDPDEATTRLFQEIRQRTRLRAESRTAPPPRAISASPSSTPPPASRLPYALTRMVGRDEEVASVRQRLTQSRLVTLIGAGGIGKTRLAMEVTALSEQEIEGGIVWVELASLADDGLFLPTLATALGIRQEETSESETLMGQIVARLSGSALLLTLDNCEHLLNAVSDVVQQLLSRCPRLCVLATSRQRFGLTGELTWRVPSLPFPESDGLPFEAILEYPAVQLFVERAVMARADFQVSDAEDARAVAQICHRLDGIPLAIELAAARIGMLSVEQIASRLGDRFSLLTSGSRGALTRHQTLRALIDWSYDLLATEEQALLCRLSVFAGGWTLEAAEAVASEDVLDLLASLVDRSLVLTEEGEAGSRYRMLETVREYAAQKLRAGEGETVARDRHLAYFLEKAEVHGPELESNPESAIRILETELDNLRAALAWAQATAIEDYLLLATALRPFWETRGYITEGRMHLRTALEATKTFDSDIRTQALVAATRLAVKQADVNEALTLGQECLERFQEQQNTRGIAEALLYLGESHTIRQDFHRATSCLVQAVAYSRESNWAAGVIQPNLVLGLIYSQSGDTERARSLLEEALTVARTHGTPQLLARAFAAMASLELIVGNYERVRLLLEEGLEINVRLGDRMAIAHILGYFGHLAEITDTAQAFAYFEEEVAIYRELGGMVAAAHVLHRLGLLHYQQDDYDAARQAFAESLAIFRELRSEVGFAYVRMNLGSALFQLGEWTAANELYRESLALYRQNTNAEGIAWAYERIAVVEGTYGDPGKAARLLGTASSMRETLSIAMAPSDVRDWEKAVVAVRTALPEAEFAVLWEEGRTMVSDQALQLATEHLRQAGSDIDAETT